MSELPKTRERITRCPFCGGLLADHTGCSRELLARIAELEVALDEYVQGMNIADGELDKLRRKITRAEAALAGRDKFEEAVRHACFDHNSVDMSGKVRWARSIPVSSVMRHIFDAYGSEPLTPNGTIPRACTEEGSGDE